MTPNNDEPGEGLPENIASTPAVNEGFSSTNREDFIDKEFDTQAAARGWDKLSEAEQEEIRKNFRKNFRETAETQSIIHVGYRFAWRGTRFPVRVDGLLQKDLSTGVAALGIIPINPAKGSRRLTTVVAPGEHTVQIKGKRAGSKPITIDLAKGEMAIFRCGTRFVLPPRLQLFMAPVWLTLWLVRPNILFGLKLEKKGQLNDLWAEAQAKQEERAARTY